MSVFFLFLTTTALGCLSTLFWIPEKDLGRGYFQMNALVLLGLLGLALAVVVLHPFQPFGPESGGGVIALAAALAAGFLYHAAVWRERWDLGRWAAAACLLATATALLLAAPRLISGPTPLPYRGMLVLFGLLSASLLLGWSLITMLLGHWYLVAPRLTFHHLVLFCRVLLAVVLLRLLAVGVTLGAALAVDEMAEPHPWRVLASFAGQGMFFWPRLLWGLAIPLALAVMALHCARRRSNQSATGILYVLVVGAFVGEIMGYYLAVTTGVPV